MKRTLGKYTYWTHPTEIRYVISYAEYIFHHFKSYATLSVLYLASTWRRVDGREKRKNAQTSACLQRKASIKFTCFAV